MATQKEDYLGIKNYKVVGTRPIRHDGVDKVTGRAVYGADVQPTGVLHGKTLRSPHAHARIKKIDTRKAEALPGVKAVVTNKDFLKIIEDKVSQLGEGTARMSHLVTNVLAADKVLYDGHAVAAVAATSPHIAEEALALIDVTYEVLPPVMEVLAAMEDGSPLLHDDQTTRSLGEATNTKSNVASHFQNGIGDIKKGFKEADVIVEREVRTGTVHQGYIEPHNATALWNQDGKLTVWCSTQGHFDIRGQLVSILGLSENDVRVFPAEIGGGFGGKFRVYSEPTAAILSRKTGLPVKFVMSRTEVLKATGPNGASFIRVKMGATKAGKLTAAQAFMAYEAGAYPGSPVGAGAGCIFSPYVIPNARIDGYDVVTNKPQTSAYRAPGATNAAFASETVIDEICEQLGMDPLEFRLKNSAKEGTRRPDGPINPRIGQVEVVKAAIASPHYKSKLRGKNRGRGVAGGFWFNGGGTSTAIASVKPDGTVALAEGSPDIGGTRTSVAMQFAEALGIPSEQVTPYVSDTDSIGHNDGTGGSRTTFATGWAGYEAGLDIRRQMINRAAAHFEVKEDAILFKDGVFSVKSDRNKKATFKEIASRMGRLGGQVVSHTSTSGKRAGAAFALVIVDVEVDTDTGKVDVLRSTIVQDVGKAIHPSYVEGQLQGGVAQGIGWGLNEEFIYNKDGVLTNASFLDYRMPTSLDLPMIETILVEVPNPGHPYGVRGVGEVPIVPPPAALANAVFDAIGIRMTELPMSPGRVLSALWNGANGTA